MVDVTEIAKLKEFYDLRTVINENKELPIAYNDYELLSPPTQNILNLQGHQIFIKNLLSPHTPYKRLLLYHSTGTGKTLVILSIAQLYIQYFQKMNQQPSFIILGFTEDIIIRELIKFTEFGYVTQSEKEELERLRFSVSDRDKARRRGLKSVLKRRITDKTRGGYYKFYGYQKFSNDLFIVTSQGVDNQITTAYLYENSDIFYKRVEEQIKKGNIEINKTLVESIKYSFIACDEIHNVYNARAKNNRGMAIEYLLRLMEKEDPLSTPRVIYASATPMTGNATEVVELLNLLIPQADYKRSDFFSKDDIFKPGALETIGELCKGYVSFLRDTDIEQYPKEIYIGEHLHDIPYLYFTPCVMSKYQEDTIKTIKNITNIETLYSTDSYLLYDMVFPNPNGNTGLFNSSQLFNIISSASPQWKEQIGITTEGRNIITGKFLKYENIGKYSEKYKTLLEEVFSILKNKEPGKILIFHYYVGTSGVLLLNEMFLQNGFLDDKSAPLSYTRCSICGKEQQHHKREDHTFTPTRILLAYGDMGTSLDNTLAMFNDPDNKTGNKYKILIGSRVIQEGVDFNNIRFLFVLSLPRDISTLIQIFWTCDQEKIAYASPTSI